MPIPLSVFDAYATQGAPAPNASYSAGGYRGRARAQALYPRTRKAGIADTFEIRPKKGTLT
jgi:hypothetical protein